MSYKYNTVPAHQRHHDHDHQSSLDPSTDRRPRKMPSTTTLLFGGIVVLMFDSLLELAFVSSMVAWLHRRAGGSFEVVGPSGTNFSLHGKPVGLLLDQGHTSNGAAGTAFVGVGLIGILALCLRRAQLQRHGRTHGLVSFLYTFWLVLNPLSVLLALAALVYTMVLTSDHDGQTIDLAVASRLDNRAFPHFVAYPLLQWTPQNWFAAVLRLPLASPSDRANIRSHLAVMRGWQWNLIPLALAGIVVCVLAFVDHAAYRRQDALRGEEGDIDLERRKVVEYR